MRLLLLHPKLALRDCGHCLKYSYNEDTGEPEKFRGADMERPPGKKFSAPCRSGKGCPKGTPENPKSLSPRNWQAWEHYRECKATGQFPDDAIVRRNARIVSEIVEHAEKLKQLRAQVLRARGNG